jgi:outer membrane protein assembly factor BamB
VEPALQTARRLFPTTFGFRSSAEARPRTVETSIYTSVTEYLHELPPDECVNFLGQPGIIQGSFDNLASTWDGGLPFSFRVMFPILLRDRRTGYILALPEGASGVFSDSASDSGEEPGVPNLSGELHLDLLSIIDPNGRHKQSPASVRFDAGGLMQLCLEDETLRATECSDEARSSDPRRPPFLYEVTRCSPGCEAWCPSGATELLDCSRPPAPHCSAGNLRLFFGGQDIGKGCQYEEWDFHCESGCLDQRCRGENPTVRWNAIVPATGRSQLVLLADDALAVASNETLTAFSKTGRKLWDERTPVGSSFQPVSSGDGGAFFLGARGEIWKIRGEAPWRTGLPGTWSTRGGLAFANDVLHATLGTQHYLLDPRRGQLLGRIDLGTESVGAPVIGPTGTVAITTSRELLSIDGKGRELSRIALPGKPAGTPVFEPNGKLVIAMVDGTVWSGPPSALRLLATLGAKTRFAPTLTPDSSALIVTEGEPHQGGDTLHKLALANGRELWRLALLRASAAAISDSRGGMWLADDSGLVAISAAGQRRWTLDLRGNEGSSPPLLGSDGTLYMSTFRRLTALGTGASRSPSLGEPVRQTN